MSEQHTKGLLITGEVGDGGKLLLADSERMSLLTIVDEDGTDFAAFYNPADARRLAACWNACLGLPTDELEKKGLVAAVGTQWLTAALRDELLSEVERVNNQINELPSMDAWDERTRLKEEIERLRAALQLAKDMFVANDLILPKTFEVMDEALASHKPE